MSTPWMTRAFCFLLCFCLEVKVKAAFLEEPQACLKTVSSDCALSASEGPEIFKTEELEISLSQNSILKIQENIRLLAGSFWVKNFKKGSLLKMAVGDIKSLTSDTQVFVEVDPNKPIWVLRVLKGEVLFANQGPISEGFEVEVNGVDANGQLVVEIPRPFLIRKLAEALRLHKFDNKKEFVIYLGQLRTTYQKAVNLASGSYQEAAERQIASLEEQKRIEAKQRAEDAKERAALIKLFREKNYLDL